MLQGWSLMALLGAVMVLALPCLGYTAKRSENLSSAWNVALSLEPEQKITVDQASSEKTSGIDKVLQTSDTPTTTKTAEQMGPENATRERRSAFILENVEIEEHPVQIVKDPGTSPVDENVINDSVPSSPQNVVLLLIADSGQNRENVWKDLKALHSFPVEGFVVSCYNTDIDATRFSLDDALVSGNKDKKCDCEHFLRSNIASLLFWARDVKGMTIGTLSNSNFTIPSMFGYEESVDISKELDETDENNAKSKIHKVKPESRSDWHVIDIGKPSNRVSSLAYKRNKREDGLGDPASNVFDMFSRIRIALFRSLLESFRGGVGAPDDFVNPPRKSHPVPTNLVDVVTELKSLPNEKGFILVATVSPSELYLAWEFLQRELSQDTLLVIAGVCKHDAKAIPFVAQGPASRMLHEATTIWDLPTIIRNTIPNSCQDLRCKIRRHEDVQLPIAQLKIIPQDEFFRRVSRNAAEPEKVEQTNDDKTNSSNAKVEEPKKPEDSNAKLETKQDQKRDESPKEKNSSDLKKANKFTAIFSTAASIVVTFALAG
ncbi:uncharacterized protein LOC128890246 [Hylaeus anthracinus]|uniref:uncharacterized protein LOC128890246 n=1 Tax=Hylaeus anthracinus TaxID=313031 RepID=UPI0023B8A0AD|nr:uncharacterized protein LOC128890246 [Hylaeus anthracinus]